MNNSLKKGLKIMLEFILQYWLNFLLGAIASGLAFICTKFWKMYQNEKTQKETDHDKKLYNDLKKVVREGDVELQEQIDILKRGILSIQGKSFKHECRELLKEDHEVSLEEFEMLQEDHNIYNSLGGNHDGDTLFKMVENKTSINLTDGK